MFKLISNTLYSSSRSLLLLPSFAFKQPLRCLQPLTKILPVALNTLQDNPGARRYPKKLGRGPASGKGKTSGRGHKGQKARQGTRINVRFQGGQTPIQRRLPKFGRAKKTRPLQILEYVNLDKINYFVKLGVLDPSQKITMRSLSEAGIVRKVKFGVKVLSRGAEKITYPIHLQVTDASKSAIEVIQKAGGSIELVHMTPLKLREHLYPAKYPIPLEQPIPPYWRIKKLQRKEKNKGLSIRYRKPKWMLQDQLNPPQPKQKLSDTFQYPVPIVQNSGKIRKRKPKLFRKFSFE